MSELAVAARPLPVIEAELDLLERDTQKKETALIENYIEVGRRLEEVKAQLPHGEWGPWLEKRGYPQAKAVKLMKISQAYGKEQQSLFGGETKSQAFTNLGFHKLVQLLAIEDEGEREKFVAEHDVEAMSTRELDKVLKERDEALRQKAEAETAKDEAEGERVRLEWKLAEAEEKVTAAQTFSRTAAERAAALSRELEELKSRPVEVAVEDASEEQLAQARAEAKAEAEEAIKKKLDKVKAALKAAEEAKNQAETEKKAAEDALAARKEQEQSAASEAVEKVRAEEAERRKALEKQLAAADPDAAAFKVYFQAWQEDYNRMSGCLTKITQHDEEKGRKLRQAVAAVVENMRQ